MFFWKKHICNFLYTRWQLLYIVHIIYHIRLVHLTYLSNDICIAVVHAVLLLYLLKFKYFWNKLNFSIKKKNNRLQWSCIHCFVYKSSHNGDRQLHQQQQQQQQQQRLLQQHGSTQGECLCMYYCAFLYLLNITI